MALELSTLIHALLCSFLVIHHDRFFFVLCYCTCRWCFVFIYSLPLSCNDIIFWLDHISLIFGSWVYTRLQAWPKYHVPFMTAIWKMVHQKRRIVIITRASIFYYCLEFYPHVLFPHFSRITICPVSRVLVNTKCDGDLLLCIMDINTMWHLITTLSAS